ncbi:MAG: hypothetical protein ACREF7_03760, partial [Candidatus Saccharimonadales bacterium]
MNKMNKLKDSILMPLKRNDHCFPERGVTRRAKGASLVEAAGSIALFVPMIVLTVFVTIESSDCYVIHQS